MVILLLISLAVFLFCAIADALDGPNDTKSDVTYESITKQSSDIHTGSLIVVNADHAYVFPESEDHLANIAENRSQIEGTSAYQLNYNTLTFHRDAVTMLDAMLKQSCLETQDSSTLITTAYRTYEDQANKELAQGHSDYHTAYSVEIRQIKGGVTSYISGPAAEAPHWLYQNNNFTKYGFIVRYPSAKELVTGISNYTYCFRYVGIPHATYITENGLCLEEYVDLLKNSYSGDEHLKITGADGKLYEVYYVAQAAEEVTTIKVPKNYSYTVSGDNIGGFIVTVNLSEPLA